MISNSNALRMTVPVSMSLRHWTTVGIVLNNGESGVVVGQNPKLPTRPIVRISDHDNRIREYDL